MSQVATRLRPRRVTGRPPRLLLAAGAITAVVALVPLVYLLVRVSEAGLQRIITRFKRYNNNCLDAFPEKICIQIILFSIFKCYWIF